MTEITNPFVLIPAEHADTFAKYPLYSQDGRKWDTRILAVYHAVKLDAQNVPIGISGTMWAMTEYNPESGEAFGICRGASVELGYFSIPELQSIEEATKQPDGSRFVIVRDLDFVPGFYTLRDCQDQALFDAATLEHLESLFDK